MSLATDPIAGADQLVAMPDRAAPLRSAAWDRIFVLGGAWLVPVPIVAFELLRRSGLSVAAAEDVVTLLVMVPLGGPHVFATYTRTLFNPRFRQQDRWLFVLAFAVIAVVAGAAVSSAFFDVLIAGSPPIRYVLTFFFFWAGVHIVQQNSYIAACYADKAPTRRRSAADLADYAVMLLAMYPVSLFRMSMVDRLDPTMHSADPAALATRIVVALTGNPNLADEYVFRIGRVAPILPGFMAHAACWIAVSAAFAVSLAVFAVKTLRQQRRAECLRTRTRLVFWMALLGFIVPLFPNLDSAFQGLNAWHSFQYLGLLWLMNKNSFEGGEIRGRVFDHLMQPGRHWRLYGTAVLGTVGLLGVVLLSGFCIERFSHGEFAMFGHDVPRLGADGRELYRPGAVLLGYYIVAFSLLLVHYLHDGAFFFRKRYVLGADAP